MLPVHLQMSETIISLLDEKTVTTEKLCHVKEKKCHLKELVCQLVDVKRRLVEDQVDMDLRA